MVIRAFGAIAAGVPFLLVPFLLVYGLDRVWVTPHKRIPGGKCLPTADGGVRWLPMPEVTKTGRLPAFKLIGGPGSGKST